MVEIIGYKGNEGELQLIADALSISNCDSPHGRMTTDVDCYYDKETKELTLVMNQSIELYETSMIKGAFKQLGEGVKVDVAYLIALGIIYLSDNYQRQYQRQNKDFKIQYIKSSRVQHGRHTHD